MPPYFSLKPPVVDTSSESESSSDSDDSLPRLQTCPGVGQPAASKLTSISNISRVLNSPKVSNAREEYFFAGTDPFSPKADSNVPELKTPRPVVQPKPSHLMQNSNISSTGKSSASLSLLKTPKPAAPKSTPSLAQPKPSTSRSDSEPWMRPSIITKFLETPSSEGSSDVGGNEYMPQDGLLDAKPILPEWDGLLFGGSENYCDEILTHPEVDTCFVNSKLAEDVALNYVTSYDMPVAGFMRDFHFNKVSHALKSIPKKFESRKEQLIALLLMFDYMSCALQEGNLFHLYEKCMNKNKRYQIESLDQNIRLVLDRLNSDRMTLDQLHSVDKLVTSSIGRIPSLLNISYLSAPSAIRRKLKVFEMEAKNKNSVYHFTDPITSSPKKLKQSKTPVKSTSSKWELKDMDFSDLMRTPTKLNHSTPLVASTPQSPWKVSTPKPSHSASVKRDLLSPSPREDRKGFSSASSVARKSAPAKITDWLLKEKSVKTNAGVTPLISNKKGKETYQREGPSSNSSSVPFANILKEKPPSKANSGIGVTSLISDKRESHEVAKLDTSKPKRSIDDDYDFLFSPSADFPSSKKTITGVSLIPNQSYKGNNVAEIDSRKIKRSKIEEDYSSDDSLPDIPDIVVSGTESETYSTWKKKLLGSKTRETHSSDKNLNTSKVACQQGKNTSIQARKSPFKASKNTWKSKFESPSKSNHRTELMSPNRGMGLSPLKH